MIVERLGQLVALGLVKKHQWRTYLTSVGTVAKIGDRRLECRDHWKFFKNIAGVIQRELCLIGIVRFPMFGQRHDGASVDVGRGTDTACTAFTHGF